MEGGRVGGKFIGAYKSGSFGNSSEDGSSRPRIFQVMNVFSVNDRPIDYGVVRVEGKWLERPAPELRPALGKGR